MAEKESRDVKIALRAHSYPLSRHIRPRGSLSFLSSFFYSASTVHAETSYCPLELFSYLRCRSTETFISGLSLGGSLF